ncbi:uncharacterized protein LOC143248238 [Tachypleus tridentatus]|uniref:uncharacterized protein LOC143248238 n=1 Tax=Tachypleus tridentatus TaxID=6853 RepID=UPI003FD5906C
MKVSANVLVGVGLLGLAFGTQVLTRFCYTSTNAQVRSQCVYCRALTYPLTSASCVGAPLPSTTTTTVNITASQAVCIISQCLQQVPQFRLFFKKKRDIEGLSKETLVDEDVLKQPLPVSDGNYEVGPQIEHVTRHEEIARGENSENVVVLEEVNVFVNSDDDLL